MNQVNDLFKKELKVVNLGIESFYRDLKSQDKTVVHVQWKPLATTNKKIISLLSKLK